MARTPKTPSASASAAASAAADREGSAADGGGTNSGSELSWSTQHAQSSNNTSNSDSPLLPSVTDPQISYTLPQWLVPERYKDKQSSQNIPQTRIFSVPLPEVPTKTRQAVRAYLVKHHPQQKSGMKDSERKLKELKLEEKQASTKAKAAKDKLAQALFERSEKLKEIRKAHEVETTKAIEELEAKLRNEQQKEDSMIEERIKEKCKLEYEKKFEEEVVHKRKREQEEDEKEEMEAASAAKKAREDNKGVVTTEAVAKSSSSDGDGAEGGNNATDLSTSKNISKVEALEKKQEDLKQKVEKLSEKKKEFYWLLKQVIKQETLQKMKMKKAKASKAK
jgi:hypothetical protein